MFQMLIRKGIRSVSAVSSAMADLNKKYEEAVKTLNTLQSNAQTIERIRKERDKRIHLNIPKMIKYAERAGITLDDIDRLSIIHVSGTKGKGSTCAYCESILRHQGYKTGFFSSPHLVEVRERFRINGSPLSAEKFTSYFWDVYNKLESSKAAYDGAMPAYFSFLTIMAFHVFMQEKTDVAIIEVGIGGQYDSTNLIRKPVVCGVTSLGLDHISILGNTIEKIAWNKAGIFKKNVPAVTVQQVPSAVQVLQDRAVEIGNPLYISPSLSSFDTEGKLVHLGITGVVQRINAALALQLCKIWMERRKNSGSGDAVMNGTPGEVLEGFTLNNKHLTDEGVLDCILGLAQCSWPGRNQKLEKPGITYYLDGAHTVESIQQCAEWFKEASARERKTKSGKVVKMILYNTTGDRDPKALLSAFVNCHFDAAVFCPNMIFPEATTADQTNNTVTRETQMQKVNINMEAWMSVFADRDITFIDSKNSMETYLRSLDTIHCDGNSPVKKRAKLNLKPTDSSEDLDSSHIHSAGYVNGFNNNEAGNQSELQTNSSSILNQSNTLKSMSADLRTDQSKSTMQKINAFTIVKKFSSIYDSLSWISQGKDDTFKMETSKQDCELSELLADAAHIQVLITGSLHLVGGVLRVVDPSYN